MKTRALVQGPTFARARAPVALEQCEGGDLNRAEEAVIDVDQPPSTPRAPLPSRPDTAPNPATVRDGTNLGTIEGDVRARARRALALARVLVELSVDRGEAAAVARALVALLEGLS